MKILYYTEVPQADGSVMHGINPPSRIRAAIGVRYQQFAQIGQAAEYSAEIKRQYERWKADEKEARTSPVSVQGMCDRYFATKGFRNLAPNSRRSYRNFVRVACQAQMPTMNKKLGEVMVKSVTKADASGVYAVLCDEYNDYVGFHAVKVMRLIFNAMYDKCKLSLNPFASLKLSAPESRAVLWEPQHVTAAIRAADCKGYHGLGTLIMLCYHLCQRPGDMRQLVGENLKGDSVHFSQEKTGTPMRLPLTPELIMRLRKFSHGRNDPSAPVVLNDRTGNPFDCRNYNDYFQEVKKLAKLPDELWLADLRRTGATEAAEAGATEDELKALTGHLSRDVLNIYVRPTANQKLANNGMNKRFGR